MNHVKLPLRVAALASLIVAPSLTAQVYVNETFDYADQAALDANWNLGANSPLSLNTGVGGPAPSVNSPGTGTNPNIWAGSTFSLTPTDANPIRLTGDIISDGLVGSVTTIGLRTGANPLFEMGLYRSFDNSQTGPDSTAILSPAGSGFGVRTIAIGQDLNGQDWVKMGDYYTGSARFEATVGELSVTTRVDVGIDGTWDFSYTETGTTPIGAFTDLRIHAPATTAAGTTGAIVDNLRLEVIPEPSTYALLGLGGILFAALRRRKA
ncbi:MAG: PEP-CTERM sorting domain-containing protein [Limisphaerales bacterium]